MNAQLETPTTLVSLRLMIRKSGDPEVSELPFSFGVPVEDLRPGRQGSGLWGRGFRALGRRVEGIRGLGLRGAYEIGLKIQ